MAHPLRPEAGQLTAYHGEKPITPQLAQLGRVAVAAIHRDRQTCQPGRGLQRLDRALQRCRPATREQVADLIAARDHLADQTEPALPPDAAAGPILLGALR